MKESFFRVLYLGALVAAPVSLIAIAYYFGANPHHGSNAVISAAHAADRLDQVNGKRPARKLWVCPMHPQILQDHPGTCPICGMDLVESSDQHEHADAGIQVDAASQQRMGVRLARATEEIMRQEVHAYGTVTIDDRSLFNVSAKIEGWVRKLHVTAVGQPVRAGQVLYEIYSPELVQRQREYIELLQRRDQLLQNMPELTGQNAQVAASYARERLRSRDKFLNADVSEQILDVIEKTRRPVDGVPVHAPRSGFVAQIGAREGSYVTPMANLLSLADLSTVWINIALYPDQLEWVREGDEVTVKLPRGGQPAVKGRLKFANPTVDGATRTVQARLVVSNSRQLFRPGAFVDVVIAAQPHKALALPRSAVMRTGKGSSVMLARGDGHFMPVAVETGIESGGFIEITDGLQQGAEVAVNGQFLLDAAASMSDAAQRMQDSH